MTLGRLLLTLTALAGGLLAPAGPAAAIPAAPAAPAAVSAVAAVAGLPVARPSATDLGFDATVDGVLPAGSGVWVAHGATVELVAAGGRLVGPVDLSAAGDLTAAADRDLALSADGALLYVTAGTAIGVYDAGSGAAVATWTSRACPRHPAALGDRVYYAFGCPGTGPYGITAIDIGTGLEVADPGIPDSFAAAPLLRSAGSVLVAVEAGAGPTARTYRREADGTVTALASATIDQPADLAVAADGSELMTATGGTVTRRDTAQLQVTGTVTPPGSTSALAYASDLGGLAVGLSGSSTDQLQVRSADDGGVVSRSAQRSAATGAANPAVLPGSLGWSADGSLLRALVHPDGGNVVLLTATALPVQPTTVTLRLTGPRRFGDPVQVRLTAPGRSGADVHLVLADPTGHYPWDAVTDGAGVVAAPLDTDMNGKVTATIGPDLTHGPGYASATFTVPAGFRIDLGGQYSTRDGVWRFRSFDRFRGLASGLPSRRYTVQLSLQALTRRGWRPAAPTQAATTDADGLLGITLGGFDRGVRYRLVVRFAGDRSNTGTSAVSRPFVIDR